MQTKTTIRSNSAPRFTRRLLGLAVSTMVALLAFVVLKTQFDALQTRNGATNARLSSTRSGGNAIVAVPLWKTWLNAWRDPNATSHSANANNASSQKTSSPTPVWVDVDSLARRHPAWKLASQLASRNASESNIAPVSAPQNRSFADNDFALGAVLRRTDSRRTDSLSNNMEDRVLDVSSFLRSRSNETSNTRNETVLARRARASQNASINDLSRDLSGDLARERALRERESRAVLEEEIEAARAASLSQISPILLSEAEQLELTNLRLKLLPSSILGDEEKRLARERLLILQSRWDEALRRQEAQNLANIEELREVEPRRLRVEGETEIALSQNRLLAADSARLRSLRESQSALLARDFDDLTALRPLSASSTRDFFAAPASPLPILNNRVSSSRAPTIAVLPTQSALRVLDVAQGDATKVAVAAAASQIASLRAQARREAANWTRIVAQREGWQIVTSPLSGAPLRNATEDVWRAWKM